MNHQRDYSQDLREIRSLMERSTKFLSLSGWSGVLIGIYALVACILAKYMLGFELVDDSTLKNKETVMEILVIAIFVLIFSIATAILLSNKKAKQIGESIWNIASKSLVINIIPPLLSGGLWIIILIMQGYMDLVPSVSLIFYGLALVVAGNYTYRALRFLGILEIFLGLICSYFQEFSLICWGIGFGILHILYGLFIHYKYEK